jgi:hypothetical protein
MIVFGLGEKAHDGKAARLSGFQVCRYFRCLKKHVSHAKAPRREENQQGGSKINRGGCFLISTAKIAKGRERSSVFGGFPRLFAVNIKC